MKKRIIALFVAALMLLSVFAMTACEDEDESSAVDSSVAESSTEEVSNEEVTPPTPKEMLVNALKNSFGESKEEGSEENDSAIENAFAIGDSKLDIDISLNKMESEGESAIPGLPLNLKSSLLLDMDSESALGFKMQADGSLTFAGETVPFDILTDGNGIYFDNFFGLTEEKFGMSDVFEMMTDMGMSSIPDTSDYEKLPEILGGIIEKVLSSNLKDDAYTAEVKDITLEGKEYKGATVVTFTLTAENAQEIFDAVIDELIANEITNKLWGEDLSLMKEDDYNIADDFSKLVVNVQIAEESIVGIDFTLDYFDYDYSYDEEILYGDECNHGDDFDEDIVYDDKELLDGGYVADNTEPEKVAYTMTFVYAVTDNGFKINFAPSQEADSEKYVITYSLGEAGELKLSADSILGEVTTTLFAVEGTVTENKFDGKLTITVNGQTIQVVFTLEYSDTNVKLTISGIVIPMDGMSLALPINAVIDITATENKCTIAGSAKMEFTGIAFDASFSITEEITEVTIEDINPEDYSSMDDPDDGERLGKQFQKLYPNIYALVMANQE